MWLMACTGPAPDERPVLIPVPQKTIWGDGTYRLPERLQLGIADTALIAAAGYVNEVLAPYGTVAVDRCDRGDIVLELDSAALPPEGYRLSVTHAGVRIGGGSYRGVVNGIATLRQLLPAKAGSGAKIPYAEIADRPAFGWRGVMLDVSRHFFDKEEIFTLLDQMARLKLNKFHWHLTDDQGWRIEIPCYPELTQEGAWRLFNRCAWAARRGNKTTISCFPSGGCGPMAPTRFTGDIIHGRISARWWPMPRFGVST